MDELDIAFFLHLGYFPRYEQKVGLDYASIDRRRYSGVPHDELLRKAGEVFQQTVSDKFDGKTRNILPISGGLDSRAILGALLECTDASNIETYTFGTPGTYDFDIGCMVAKWAGTKHTAIALDDVEWTIQDFEEAAKRFDYQTFLFHHAPVRELRRFEGGITWSGYIGDAITGGHLSKNSYKSLQESKLSYLNKRKESKSEVLQHHSLDTFLPFIGGGEMAPDVLSYDEQVLLSEVGSITAPHVLMGGFNYETPFINSPIWDFYMSIPDEYRYGQALFIESMQKEYTALFDLPCKTAYGLALNSSDLSVFFRRGRNKIWNIAKQTFRFVDMPALPMTNYFDIDFCLRKNNHLKDLVKVKLDSLKGRDVVPYLDIDAIWDRHQRRTANHGDVIKLLFSLEVNLEGRGL